MNRTIALDFDGVLHSYISGWRGPEIIPDPPVPGMASACRQLASMGYELVVMSSRARYPGATTAIKSWLVRNDFPSMEVTAEKIPAEVYIDDRGFRFEGNPDAMLCFILGGGMTPWNKGAQTERHP